LSKRRKRLLLAVLLLILLPVLLCVYATLVEPMWIRVELVTVTLANLPEEFDGYQIALLSDFHVSRLCPGSLWRVHRAVQKANRESPDLVLLAGDFSYHSTRLLPECFAALRKLKSVDGVLAVTGNHDHWDGVAAVRRHLGDSHIPELENKHVAIERQGSRIWLAGVGDLWTDTAAVARAIEGIPKGETIILLSHNPDVAPRLRGLPVDLLLAGHTHGGQVWLPIVGAPRVPSAYGNRYRAGYVREGSLQVYVTRGIGLIYPPVRFLCPPEATVLTLRKGSPQSPAAR